MLSNYKTEKQKDVYLLAWSWRGLVSVNIKVVLLTAGRNTEPPGNGQWFRMTARPSDITEIRIRR